MAPSAKDLRTPISSKELIEFLAANHNLMIYADADAKKAVRSLANEFGVDFENVGYTLKDHESEYSN